MCPDPTQVPPDPSNFDVMIGAIVVGVAAVVAVCAYIFLQQKKSKHAQLSDEPNDNDNDNDNNNNNNDNGASDELEQATEAREAEELRQRLEHERLAREAEELRQRLEHEGLAREAEESRQRLEQEAVLQAFDNLEKELIERLRIVTR
jgi:hypothetical protein